MAGSEHILHEIPPLSQKDCFHMVERYKTEFTFPLHQHREFEINFIEHGAGVRRIVGDSIEYIGEYDLVLIGGEELEHVWEQGNCKSKRIREVTIQFSPELLSKELLEKNQFRSIQKMLLAAEHGLSFPLSAILKVYAQIDTLVSEEQGFTQFLHLLQLLYSMSQCDNARVLSSSSFAHTDSDTESRRVRKVKDYITEHFNQEITLNHMADLVGMTPAAFSRFFKLRSGKTLTEVIIEIRLGYAARMLVDTSKAVSEICYECGFNNLSNFNRLFKNRKGMTPKLFRAHYKHSKVTV